MATLLQFIELSKYLLSSPIGWIHAGGPGSGCNPAAGHCGRPITQKTYNMMVRKMRQTGLKIKRGMSPWDVVKTYDAWKRGAGARLAIKQGVAKSMKKAKGRIAKAIKQGKAGSRIKAQPNISINVQPVWKGRVKNQFVAQQGHLVTELKSPKQYEKNKGTWVNKPSPYKGQFLVDLAEHRTYNDPKERNTFFIHQAAPDKGVSVEVHRNLGNLSVNVIERKLGEYGAIIDHREVSFRNIGRASGFLNKRYGLTFKLKPQTKE
jgi:hypothetical protein